MAVSLEYGQRISGIEVGGRELQAAVFNEREVRASAGLLMLLGIVAFFLALLDQDYTLLRIASAYFLFEFAIRVTVGIHRTPSGLLARAVTRRYPPDWASAKPKRFAWTMGVGIAFAMTIITNAGITGLLPRSLCLLCITLLWLESVLGFCVGCEIYAFGVRKGWARTDPAFEVCAGGVCEIVHQPRATPSHPAPAVVMADGPEPAD